ncbi:aquaporin [Candidatus Finniella inopinata]|uniref:Aquaporin n=1 Tax=Candidatus Finniella inopinata TaxID=1696036 RepID=A0A4V2DZY6_9PROT|nr:aquaporin [Candidatus Finniella inopinata]
MPKYFAEFIGTLLLVVMGVGAAVLAGSSIGFLGVSLAFGLTLMLLAYTIGPVSGCHINPAVTLALCFAGKFQARHVIPYIIMQVAGALVGAAIVYVIASGKAGFDVHAGFASNGFGAHSPMGYTCMAAAIIEVVTTAVLVFAVLCTTRNNFPAGFGGLLVGITLVAIHLVSIPVTNTSANFARSFATAVFAGRIFLDQLWLFGAAHIIASIAAVTVFRILYCKD